LDNSEQPNHRTNFCIGLGKKEGCGTKSCPTYDVLPEAQMNIKQTKSSFILMQSQLQTKCSLEQVNPWTWKYEFTNEFPKI